MTTTRSPVERQPLSRVTIVETAVALADEEGLGALSMRNLARRLGYEVMSLYNHVANKDELLGLMVDQVAAEIGSPPEDSGAFEAARFIAIATRDSLTRHPWATPQLLRHMPGPNRIQQMENLLRVLNDSGLSPELAHHGFHAITNHVLGYTLQEQEMSLGMGADSDPDEVAADFMATVSPEIHPHTIAHVHQHLNGESGSSFELVLDLIIDGLVRLNQE